ncbi:peptidase, partial [Escherichia coli]|nr:peptidase [Escherichia coli]
MRRRINRHLGKLAAAVATASLTAAIFVLPAKAQAVDPKAVVKTYADIALATYEDSLTTAKTLDGAIDALIAKPNQ